PRAGAAHAPGGPCRPRDPAAPRRAGGRAPEPPPASPAGGPPCPAGSGPCPACTPAAPGPSYSALLRVLRFARPRTRVLILGFVLTLAGTAASLVPPYLTMPLLDRVLVPHQNGQPADFGLVPWLLWGLAAAAVLGSALVWAR